MIAQLSGTVVRVGATSLVLDVGGVGFAVHATPRTTADLRTGEHALLHTRLVVREDSLTLFGFGTAAEGEQFELVQTATGVGPKLALALCSVLSPEELARAVHREDVAALTAVPGIGLKGARRLILELKDRVGALEVTPSGSVGEAPPAWREQVSEGLLGLGWSARDAEAACEGVAALVEADPQIGIASLMRAALASLARA